MTKILLIDDDPGVRDAFVELMGAENVVHAPTSEIARLLLLTTSGIECLVVDTTESVGATQEFIHAVRQVFKTVGIVIYSGRAHDHEKLSTLGVNSIFDKTRPVSEVVAAVERAARLTERGVDLVATESLLDEFMAEAERFSAFGTAMRSANGCAVTFKS